MDGNAQLVQLIASEIARIGPVSFRWFMEQALYHPDYGYYCANHASGRIGREGDFFTNVSVGPLFGRLLASQFIEMWEHLGRPAPFTIVEQGANNGEFAADALGTLGETIPFLEYRIVEPLAALRELQARKLAGFSSVRWEESLEGMEPFCGVHFSNELLDAMPFHLVRFSGGTWKERRVDFQEGKFVLVEFPAGEFPELPPIRGEGHQTEVNREATRWVELAASKISRGFILAIDYGYPREEFYHPDRSAGTLTCYRQHRRSSDPLEHIGETDITAHVEFTSVIERACSCGMRLCGFTDQHRYMVGLAAPHLHELDAKSLRAFRTLMHPAFMGSAFKVLALEKGVEATLRGFPR